MGKITYEDKVALIENPDIPDINKVKSTDMNEIKSVVNENDDKFLTNGLNISNEVDEDYRVNLIYSNNMINTETNTDNYYLDSTGTPQSSSSWYYTDYIKVKEGQKINITGNMAATAGSGVYMCFYNSSKTFVSSIPYSSYKEDNTIINIPSGVSYLRMSGRIENESTAKIWITPSINVDGEEIFPQPIQEIDISSYKNTSVVSSVDTSKVYKIGNIYFFNITLTINQSGEWKPIFANLPFTPSDTYNLMGINENNEGIRAAINAQGNIIIRNVPRANVRYYITGTLIF